MPVALRPVRLPSMLGSMVTAVTLTLAVSGCSSTASETPEPASSPVPNDIDDAAATDRGYAQQPAAAIDAARASAAKDQRPVLLDFGADWCVDCVVLDELYGRPAVAPVLDNSFHLVKIDVGEFDKNSMLPRSMSTSTRAGFPPSW